MFVNLKSQVVGFQSFKSLWEVFGDDVIMNASVFVSMLNMNDSETFHCTF